MGRGVSQNKLFVSFVKKLKKIKEIDLLCSEDVLNPFFLPEHDVLVLHFP